MTCWKQGRGLPRCGDVFPRELALKIAHRLATCSEILGHLAERGEGMILDLPDRRQENSCGCGRAALEAVCLFHGIPLPGWVDELPNTVQGISPDAMEAVLWRVLGNVCRGSMDVDALRYWTRRSRPVLCPVTDPVLGGHWVVCRGVSRNVVHLHCPVVGPKEVKVADWDGQWRDETGGREYERYAIVGWPKG